MFNIVLRVEGRVEYMGHLEKTVFLSYRRNNAAWALAIVQDLTRHRYDVFSDFSRIRGGDFETVILDNIKARAHFIVLLTPSALKLCSEPGDWLRREVETALRLKRNIVPLMLEGFKFNTPSIVGQLTGKDGSAQKLQRALGASGVLRRCYETTPREIPQCSPRGCASSG